MPVSTTPTTTPQKNSLVRTSPIHSMDATSLPSTLGIWMRLYLSNRVTVIDSGEYRHLHDRALATVRTTPPKRQWGSRRRAMAMALGMLHWRHSPSVRCHRPPTFRLHRRIPKCSDIIPSLCHAPHLPLPSQQPKAGYRRTRSVKSRKDY
jgi:hypothetical protein